MIIYDLSCSQQHEFEGWFRSVEDFGAQLGSGMLVCPQCGSEDVRRIPSTPNVSTRDANGEGQLPDSVRPQTATATIGDPRSIVRQLTNALIASTEDVGDRFAQEARKIHSGESAARGIRGRTTEKERESLACEGISVLQLPALDADDLN